MNITAKELSGNHISKTITTPIGITGNIAAIDHEEDGTWVHLDPPTSSGIHTLELNPDTPITIQEDK
ncbi:hypothetical protein [Glutamicibacter sp. ZJUTW]|uniref:hypothetical protein n=1 Tax=Glutamicibacter sp. ZJUTW TaxID=1155384 RepID=UPI0011F16508|nr:hypothetical protein [Glutamicibacter sp. ZJUTW]QEP06173.1 hypothetical protein F0M17_02320 [Glutamicibacter sp. ZJUTW]